MSISAEKKYTKRLGLISKLCENSKLNLVQTYWKIGKNILDMSDDPVEGAVYGNNFMEKLSNDLSARYGRGFSVTNLKCMRQFCRAYEYGRLKKSIDWSSYIQLLLIKDPEQRDKIENKILSERLTNYLLRREVANERISLLMAKGIEYEPPRLNCIRGRLYTYRLAAGTSSHSDITVDCGFNIRRSLPLQAGFESTDYVVSKKNGDNYSFLKAPEQADELLYTYRARVERIIDGDTLLALIDCGFHTAIRKRLRLRGIDAPETGTPEGREAAKYVATALARSGVICLRTYKPDKYERYLSDVYYLPGVEDAERIIREGNFPIVSCEMWNK